MATAGFYERRAKPSPKKQKEILTAQVLNGKNKITVEPRTCRVEDCKGRGQNLERLG